MKPLFRIMTLFLTLFCFAGCDDDEEVLSTLNVTAANLTGLGNWWNGTALPCKQAVTATLHSTVRIRLIKCMISLTVCTPVSKRVVLRLKKKRI